MKTLSQIAMSHLVGKKLTNAHRAADMLCFGFGEHVEVEIPFRGMRKAAEIALNVKCPWRVQRPNEIIVASDDMYYSASDTPVPEDFQWDIPGTNRCDRKLEMFFRRYSPCLKVESIDADEWGGLILHFKRMIDLVIFPDTTGDEEHWRIIFIHDPGCGKHVFWRRGRCKSSNRELRT
jgi:hypothetical protein